MSRLKKQGKSDSMDDWLEAQGLYRKHTAKDGSCLFRAVAEQVFNTQALHLDVRIACVRYMLLHREKFEDFIEGPFDHHLYNLQNPKEWAGHVEMYAMSLMYKRDFIIFQEDDKYPHKVTDYGYEDKIMLCFSHGNHYDSIYHKSYIGDAAICQSIVYDLLYKDVFSLGDEVDLAVEKMLHDKAYAKHRKDSTASQDSNWDKSNSPSPDFLLEQFDLESSGEWKDKQDGGSEIKRALSLGIPPFPYKVAKALDPDIYRNVEFDVWNDQRKDEPQFEPGVKCLVRIEKDQPETFHAHIQEILGEKGPVTVYIEELGEKQTVAYDALEPLPSSLKNWNWQTPPIKNFKTLSGYYQKTPLNGAVQEIDKFKGRKKLSKKRFKETQQLSFAIPIGRGQVLPPRMQQHQVQFEPVPVVSFARGRASPPIVVNRSPSPRLKWTQSGQQQNPRYRHKNNSGGRFNAQAGGMNSPPIEDGQRKSNNDKELYEYSDQDLSAFPALPKSQGLGHTSPCSQVSGVWSRQHSSPHNSPQNSPHNSNANNGPHQQPPPSPHPSGNQTPQSECSSNDSRDMSKKYSSTELVPHSSRSPTPPVPILQPSPAHPLTTCLPVSGSPSSLSLSHSPPPSSPLPIPTSLSSSIQSLPQQHHHHHRPPPSSQMPPHLIPSPALGPPNCPPPPLGHHMTPPPTLSPQPTPPPPSAYSYIPMPPVYSGMLVPFNDNSSHPINFNVGRSHDLSGNDLPLSDLPTLRFFFNLGYDYFRMSSMIPVQQQPPPPQYTMWNYGSHMAYSPVNGFTTSMPGSDNGDGLEDASCGSNGQCGQEQNQRENFRDELELGSVGSVCLEGTCNRLGNLGVEDSFLGDVMELSPDLGYQNVYLQGEMTSNVHNLLVDDEQQDADPLGLLQEGFEAASSSSYQYKLHDVVESGNAWSRVGLPYASSNAHVAVRRVDSNQAVNFHSNQASQRMAHLPPRFQRSVAANSSGSGRHFRPFRSTTMGPQKNRYEGQPLLQVGLSGQEHGESSADGSAQHLSTSPLYFPMHSRPPASPSSSSHSSSQSGRVVSLLPASFENSGVVVSNNSNSMVYRDAEFCTQFNNEVSLSPHSSSSDFDPTSNAILPSASSVGFYPSPGSPASTPAALTTSPAVYYSHAAPYMYQQPPPMTNSLPHQVSFLPAAVQ